MTPLNKIKKGIEASDMKMVADGYMGITGETVTIGDSNAFYYAVKELVVKYSNDNIAPAKEVVAKETPTKKEETTEEDFIAKPKSLVFKPTKEMEFITDDTPPTEEEIKINEMLAENKKKLPKRPAAQGKCEWCGCIAPSLHTAFVDEGSVKLCNNCENKRLREYK